MQIHTPTSPLLFIAGASGYVGGRLARRLLERGFRVRCMARRTEGLHAKCGEGAETVEGDVLKPETLPAALEGVHTAYYLVHALGAGGDFEAREKSGARNFSEAARRAGVSRIIFLGGLADDRVRLSPHMRSRHETGRMLREGGVPVLEFRASIILGAGSLSFEMIRALVQRLPVMITPRWVRVPAQPLFVEDLLDYLCAALDLPPEQSLTLEIGGSEQTSYLGLMQVYARQRGLRRIFLPVPFLSPRISSLWLGLVTPLFARVGRKLIESVTHPSIVNDPAAERIFPQIRPRGVEASVRDALAEEERGYALTRWSDSLASGNTHRTWAGVRFGTRLVDSRSVISGAPPEAVFAAIERIGGRSGWYYGNGLWQLRGALDELAGGVGMRRGRRHPDRLEAGEALDCWRVETVERPRRLRLRAEMKLPGRAWLEFEVDPLESAPGCRLRQTAVFDPLGLSGLLYWYGIFPLHALIFRGMLNGILQQAARSQREDA